MKTKANDVNAVQYFRSSNTGDSSERSRPGGPAISSSKVEDGLRAITEALAAHLDRNAEYVGEVASERLHSLFGAIFDVLDDEPAEESEANVGSPVEPETNTTFEALESLRIGFQKVADERDRMRSALESLRRCDLLWSLPDPIRIAVVAALNPPTSKHENPADKLYGSGGEWLGGRR